jgi:hypothetical protein
MYILSLLGNKGMDNGKYMPFTQTFFKNTKYNIIFKGKQRLKTCHWVLIGAMAQQV